ncbi:MAG: UvrD-helicase domain-containing protein [Parcubacteria group bacterium]|jgi:DNA helicase-2/ATP-dependent DNA helicase PcrA
MNDILAALNKKQREAVTITDGPILIIAGAGSGKTRTLTHKVAYLIREKKVRPGNILAVTFTNKSAGEMKERIIKLLTEENRVPSKYDLPLVGTFHSICAKILRKEIDKLGYERSFNIIDDHDQMSLMKKMFARLEISKDQFNPRAILEAISKAKNNLADPHQFSLGIGGYFEEVVSRLYSEYQNELKKNNSLDFDDLIMFVVKIFQKFPEVLEKYQNQFHYVLVDEYQDTNHSQYLLVNFLAKKYRNLCVVGDDWQSIYGWRQADINNILDFEKDYSEAKVISLEQNYRSSQVILDAAYGVISQNVFRKDKKLWTEKEGGQLITSYEAGDEVEEADFVAREILKSSGGKYSDFVVLYRTNAQSRILEEIFLKRSIPYKIVGGIKFYQRKEIKDVVSYLRFIKNPKDYLSLERIINEPKRGLGDKTIEKWVAIAKENKLDLLQAGTRLANFNNPILPAGRKDSIIKKIPDSKLEDISKFCEFIGRMRETMDRIDLTDFIQKVFSESGYEKYLQDGTMEGEMRWENVKELITVAQKYDKEEISNGQKLEEFLEEVALATDADKGEEVKDSVYLMTLHSAKGLEFSTVFIVGLEEGIIPHSRSMLSQIEMEEERRLMYVGITRAKEKAYLCFTRQRNIFGSTQINPPSRFLSEIPEHLLDNHESRIMNYDSDFEKNKKSIAHDSEFIIQKFKDGEHVHHPDFGDGVVISIQGDIITVAFKKNGIKKLALKFAPLKKI